MSSFSLCPYQRKEIVKLWRFYTKLRVFPIIVLEGEKAQCDDMHVSWKVHLLHCFQICVLPSIFFLSLLLRLFPPPPTPTPGFPPGFTSNWHSQSLDCTWRAHVFVHGLRLSAMQSSHQVVQRRQARRGGKEKHPISPHWGNLILATSQDSR